MRWLWLPLCVRTLRHDVSRLPARASLTYPRPSDEATFAAHEPPLPPTFVPNVMESPIAYSIPSPALWRFGTPSDPFVQIERSSGAYCTTNRSSLSIVVSCHFWYILPPGPFHPTNMFPFRLYGCSMTSFPLVSTTTGFFQSQMNFAVWA